MNKNEVPLWMIITIGIAASIILLVVAFAIMPAWLADIYQKTLQSNPEIRENTTGPIGDTFGGAIGPIIAAAGALVTFLAFYIQYEANQQQRYDIKLERFENKFYELIRLHRANVDEIDLDGSVRGRKAFPQMIGELRYIYDWIMENKSLEYLLDDNDDDDYSTKVLNFSYMVFFFGIGYSSERQLTQWLNNKDLETFGKVRKILKDTKSHYKSFKEKNPDKSYVINLTEDGEHDRNTFEIDYTPLNGHAIWLGHYYRHLFQAVRYVAEQDEHFLSVSQKQSYLKTLRAQLSNEEQVLLYYNCLSDFGKIWHKKEFFTKYFMLKNLPLAMIDMGADPHEIIGIADEQGKYYFEWDRLKKTPKKSKHEVILERKQKEEQIRKQIPFV